ncbi:MAG: division/cell wall cluster transcriptional repressor MraZ [Firmicutes bacterium]|nr:division/cell wall cluster transcriptional repressor MraZ [Bacillota bacterium]
MLLMGEYHHSIDEKGRITIPSKVRYDLGESFIVTRGLDNCLYVYPKEQWETIITKYQQLPNTKDARNFMRFFLSGATACEFDKQGRINIQAPLIHYADLKKDCVIVGVSDHLEIWSQERWDTLLLENEENFSNMADELFSNLEL